MSEGTRSYLFGSHGFFFHPFFVLKTWMILYKKFPTWWELIGIFLHDIGVIGLPYLSKPRSKYGHWKRGANLTRDIVKYICYKLKYDDSKRAITVSNAYYFCAGHAPKEYQGRKSKLYLADKLSWVYCPIWWMKLNHKIENFSGIKPLEWREAVKSAIVYDNVICLHELYYKTRKVK